MARPHILGFLLSLPLLAAPRFASAQGCMPVRFVSPVVGGQGDVYLRSHTWQAGVSWRRLTSNQFIVSHDVRNDLGPGGEASYVHLNSFVFSLGYGFSDRLSITANLPVATGSESRIFPDKVRHEASSTGLGDINLIATRWFRRVGLEPRGNLAIGLGIKAPTGGHNKMGEFWGRDSTYQWWLDQSLQWGDGGWGLTFQLQGFQPIFDRSYLYLAGSYTANPRRVTEVTRPAPNPPTHWAVPDTWEARLGAAMTVWPERGITLSLGGQVDGTTRQDLFGGRDEGFRRPAIVGYLDPGISMTWKGRSFSLNVPVRVYKRFRPSYVEAPGKVGGGGLARYLLIVSASQRFGSVRAGRTPPIGRGSEDRSGSN